MITSHEKRIKNTRLKFEEDATAATVNRARAITIGTCFNGISEIIVRGNDGRVLWAPLQEEEVIKLVVQLAAGIGRDVFFEPADNLHSWKNKNSKYR